MNKPKSKGHKGKGKKPETSSMGQKDASSKKKKTKAGANPFSKILKGY